MKESGCQHMQLSKYYLTSLQLGGMQHGTAPPSAQRAACGCTRGRRRTCAPARPRSSGSTSSTNARNMPGTRHLSSTHSE